MRLVPKNIVRFDQELRVFVVKLPDFGSEEFALDPAVVRRNDTSAKSIKDWTGRVVFHPGVYGCMVVSALAENRT